MKNRLRYLLAVAALCAVCVAGAQETDKSPRAELRFDEATTQELPDVQAPPTPPTSSTSATAVAAESGDDAQLPTVFIVNGKPLSCNDADNLVTLWNIEDLKVLVCGDARLKVRYLIYKIQKRYRPHLEGNVAGYGWTARTEAEERDWKQNKHLPPFIGQYILRETYDSLRRVTGTKSVLDNRIGGAWRTLPRDVLYLLDGKPIMSDALVFLDGLVIKSLDFVPPRKAVAAYGECARNGAFVAILYKNRMPMILFDDTPIRFSTWLRFCTASQINMDSGINYRYISPVEATARYGEKGRYGCIYVRTR